MQLTCKPVTLVLPKSTGTQSGSQCDNAERTRSRLVMLASRLNPIIYKRDRALEGSMPIRGDRLIVKCRYYSREQRWALRTCCDHLEPFGVDFGKSALCDVVSRPQVFHLSLQTLPSCPVQ